jgi:A/G-specific adenine glycosylase
MRIEKQSYEGTSGELIAPLLEWFGQSARDLPWRRTRDPYAIWVSEIMLQQTQVKTVVPYWERWMRALPDVASLAKARPHVIHKLWEGLGYYTRVRNMQKAARVITENHGGRFPQKFDDVLALPGIGRYTAGAICSIAFGQPTPILDGNVMRVFCRWFGVEGDPRGKETNARLWGLAEELVRGAERLNRLIGEESLARKKKLGVSQFNQALMELGALVCTPRQPGCTKCPIAKGCVAHRDGRADKLPELAKRPRVTQRRFVAFVAEHRGQVLVRQRPAGVVNAHLWEIPNVEIGANGVEIRKLAQYIFGPTAKKALPFCTIKHSITRYRITLEAFRVTGNFAGAKSGNAEGQWVSCDKLDRLPFTSAHRKILTRLQTQR